MLIGSSATCAFGSLWTLLVWVYRMRAHAVFLTQMRYANLSNKSLGCSFIYNLRGLCYAMWCGMNEHYPPRYGEFLFVTKICAHKYSEFCFFFSSAVSWFILHFYIVGLVVCCSDCWNLRKLDVKRCWKD